MIKTAADRQYDAILAKGSVDLRVDLDHNGVFTYFFIGVCDEIQEELLANLGEEYFEDNIERHIENEGLSEGYFFLQVRFATY